MARLLFRKVLALFMVWDVECRVPVAGRRLYRAGDDVLLIYNVCISCLNFKMSARAQMSYLVLHSEKMEAQKGKSVCL